MLRANEVKRKLARGDLVHGLFCTAPAPEFVEMIAHGGYDFVVLDTEHTLLGGRELIHAIRAAEACGLTPFVRIAKGDFATGLRALDAGAMGIVVPHVRSRADVSAAIDALYYAPLGKRSLGSGRSSGFGRYDPVEHLRRANDEIMLVALIEDAEGVADIDRILSGGGVDMVLPGPADLSQSFGVPWQLGDVRVRDALDRLRAACAEHGVPYCAMARTSQRYAQWRAADVRAFVCGDAVDLAAAALRRGLAELRG
ncbi:HpcH/HpaI aldolase family protein [Nocardia bhagyanarayanae]|uniref:4-hydroxy-2-oxoheptanedioate aldolase n=1 Tax=Nocardia bhagyanarayanae TaxID=1215925 RepID=A0A543EXJ5_9NOCA|nr:aldolase/citrate lyase family protein [Nocardia bhagyanarayanae]TQM26306.1 4-hydroxy-2-oxoheptanedioate aldolase [Nocardia bhagyanarayanae]